MPSCSQPSRTLRASGPKGGPSLTAAARAGISSVQVGTEGWGRSNKRMGPKKAETQNQAKYPTRFPEEAEKQELTALRDLFFFASRHVGSPPPRTMEACWPRRHCLPRREREQGRATGWRGSCSRPFVRRAR